MSEQNQEHQKTAAPAAEEAGQTPEMTREEFFKRFGVYSAGAAAGLFLLMSPRTSRAASDSAP
jgi:hypothetical protein